MDTEEKVEILDSIYRLDMFESFAYGIKWRMQRVPGGFIWSTNIYLESKYYSNIFIPYKEFREDPQVSSMLEKIMV